jgi:glycosyltransferase involved in cell wall biosynthesis
MRAAVYNRFWHSMGGGERHSGMIAQLLSQSGVEVDLIGHAAVSAAKLSSRLALDLSKTTLRIVPDRGEDAMSEMSAEYDLFVNGTYMSRLVARSPRSAYLCYFPTPFDHELTAAHRLAIRYFGPLALQGDSRLGLHHGTGWYPPEGGRRRKWIWSNGDGRLRLPAGPEVDLVAEYGRPGGFDPTTVTVSSRAVELASIDVDPAFARHTFSVPASDAGRELRFSSTTFSPGSIDPRELGFALSRPRLSGTKWNPRQELAVRFPWLLRNPQDLSFIDSYTLLLANSAYTQEWISRLWNADSDILFPPIDVRGVTPRAERERVILTTGRFFAPGHGHSKRQLEMVQMFGELVRSGQLDGWQLVVVGGCEEQQVPYLEKVRAAAARLPVQIHANAPRSLVESLMSSAAIFWSATGFGENTERRPWTNEHFGMTTAEAMAGGCVPVVIDRAGQREIVREGIDGFRWRDPQQLRIRTVQVATDERLRARLATSAIERAADFSDAAFADRWQTIVTAHDLLAEGSTSHEREAT